VGDPLELTHNLAERMLGRLPVEPVRSVRLDVPGFYGREDVARNSDRVLVRMRQFIGAHRLYVAIAVVPEAPQTMAVADQFMESVSIDPRDALYERVSGNGPGRWGPVYLPEDDFAVQMPAINNVSSRSLRLPSAEAAVRSYEARGETAYYRISVIILSEGTTDTTLDEIARAFALGERTGPSTASGFPGYALIGETQSHATESRIYRTTNRVYVLQAMARTAGGSLAADNFFDSLRIL
jgi:hypothetical protein